MITLAMQRNSSNPAKPVNSLKPPKPVEQLILKARQMASHYQRIPAAQRPKPTQFKGPRAPSTTAMTTTRCTNRTRPTLSACWTFSEEGNTYSFSHWRRERDYGIPPVVPLLSFASIYTPREDAHRKSTMFLSELYPPSVHDVLHSPMQPSEIFDPVPGNCLHSLIIVLISLFRAAADARDQDAVLSAILRIHLLSTDVLRSLMRGEAE